MRVVWIVATVLLAAHGAEGAPVRSELAVVAPEVSYPGPVVLEVTTISDRESVARIVVEASWIDHWLSAEVERVDRRVEGGRRVEEWRITCEPDLPGDLATPTVVIEAIGLDGTITHTHAIQPAGVVVRSVLDGDREDHAFAGARGPYVPVEPDRTGAMVVAAVGGVLVFFVGAAAALAPRWRKRDDDEPTPRERALARLGEIGSGLERGQLAPAMAADGVSRTVRGFVEARVGTIGRGLTTAEMVEDADVAAAIGVGAVGDLDRCLSRLDEARFIGAAIGRELCELAIEEARRAIEEAGVNEQAEEGEDEPTSFELVEEESDGP